MSSDSINKPIEQSNAPGPSRFRSGVTVLEVLFATGIVIFGILGIASLIPLAARNANQANEASQGQAYGQRYYAEFLARGFNNSSTWRWFNDNTKSFVAFAHSDAVPSTGGVGGSVCTPNRHAICIDPGFFADALTFSEIAAADFSGGSSAYRPGLFPYYQDTYDPTSSVASPASLGSNRPRLLRVSLHDPASSLNVIPAKAVQQLFSSVDDLAMTLPDDKTLPPLRVFDFSNSRAQSRAEYSWLATLTPREFTGDGVAVYTSPEDYYTLSIVVMHRRDRAWFRPTGASENDIPQGERLFTVTPLSGNFIGGDGGRVTLTTQASTDDEIGIGDWLMLSRYQTGGADRGIVARWYRIVAVDGDAIRTDTVWSRNVVLDGPDWVFDTSLPTQATYLSNVVTVFERVIPVE